MTAATVAERDRQSTNCRNAGPVAKAIERTSYRSCQFLVPGLTTMPAWVKACASRKAGVSVGSDRGNHLSDGQ